jgi:hypothetical protein
MEIIKKIRWILYLLRVLPRVFQTWHELELGHGL